MTRIIELKGFSAMANGALNAIYSWQAAAIAFFCSTLIGVIFWLSAGTKSGKDESSYFIEQ